MVAPMVAQTGQQTAGRWEHPGAVAKGETMVDWRAFQRAAQKDQKWAETTAD